MPSGPRLAAARQRSAGRSAERSVERSLGQWAKGEEPKVAIPGLIAPEESSVSDTEANEMEEHLRGLG